MEARLKYYLEIADNAWILSHRLAENCSKGPYLEEDLACTNTSLDLIGWAESIYKEAAKLDNSFKNGDAIAYERNEWDYFNNCLVEQPNTDFAYIMTRQFFQDVFNYYFLTELTNSKDSFLAEFATKSLKECIYHLKRSSEWMIRFGQGTEESLKRVQDAVNNLWKYTDQLFISSEADLSLRADKISVNLDTIKSMWNQKIGEIFYFAEIQKPEIKTGGIPLGKNGHHTEYLGTSLCEIQYLHMKYPDAVWF